QVAFQTHLGAEIAQLLIQKPIVLDLVERLAIGDVTQFAPVLENADVPVIEPKNLRIKMLRDQRVEILLQGRDLVGAAHRKADDERLVLRQQPAAQQDVNG